MPAVAVTTLSLVSYLVLYTAYSKMNKTLELQLLLKVLTVSEGLEHTLIEMNKAISLAGLTVLAMAFCPGFDAMRWELLWHAMVLLWTHSCYSLYQFYGATHIPPLSEFPGIFSDLSSDNAKQRVRPPTPPGNAPARSPFSLPFAERLPLTASARGVLFDQAVGMKKLSIILGSAGQVMLSAGYWGYVSVSTLCYLGVGLGTMHFYTMEIDYKWVLQVRPYAYLPFALAVAAVLWH